MKTSELIGPALDWAVAKCEGWDIKPNTHRFNEELVMLQNGVESVWFDAYHPSTDWSQGGPIIERERIKIDPRKKTWEATIWNEPVTQNPAYGSTPLIAAMRCYVASKLGDEVEIPKELV